MSTDAAAHVVEEVDGAIGIIRLNRPDKFNCLSLAVLGGITAALDRFEATQAVRAVLIASEGKHFCTGADLGEVESLLTDRSKLERFIAIGHATLCRLEASPLPVVAAVQGLCLAGGLELTLACDVVFGAATARFGDQHAQFGLIPGWGGSQRLTRAVGTRRAMDLFFSASWIDAKAAQDWGLINHVTEADPRTEAIAYCRTLSERSRSGLAMMKRLARQGTDKALEDGLRLEQDLAVDALLSPDVAEGLAAFQARRKPRFA